MEIGNRIKTLRQRRGATQEELASYIGVTSQAVSKWENAASVPDIALLPALSAYFGVSIDELFALSDETRMERIQNMLWDVRYIEERDIENERSFLLEKARREPDRAEAYEMLARVELHLAEGHNSRAAEYALDALSRDPNSHAAVCSLSYAMGGRHIDPRNNMQSALISYYRSMIEAYPEASAPYPWLIAQLIDIGRTDEAAHYCELLEKLGTEDFTPYFTKKLRVRIAIADGDFEAAEKLSQELDTEYPDDWMTGHDIGDFLMLEGRYDKAKEQYKKTIDMMPRPRYTDPIDSLAKVCEADGDINGAIEARSLELYVLLKEWGETVGESVDSVKREISRLQKLIK